ncbi:type II secretion system protein [Cytobacillus sp. FSL R7-0696]|uniref:PilW family protein n=1 Tax=Cytobacillus sp. FSL R7-0696 TaxID=2921691 RepID=UPI0030FC5C41
MGKYNYKNNIGMTLIEVLATIAILSIISSVIYGTFISIEKTKSKTFTSVNLRQESNLIMAYLRDLHQVKYATTPQYSLSLPSLLLRNDIHFKDISIKPANQSRADPYCSYHEDDVKPLEDCLISSDVIDVQFTLAGGEDTFSVHTKINKLLLGDKEDDSGNEENPGDGGGGDDNGEDPNEGENSTCSDSFYQCMIESQLFIHGSSFAFHGNRINGSDATIYIGDSLKTTQINGGALSSVSNLFIDGDVNLQGGSAGLGSASKPGQVCINGDFSATGGRSIYGHTVVNGRANIKDTTFYQPLTIMKDAVLPGGTYKDIVHIGGDTYIKDAYFEKALFSHQDLTVDWTPSFSPYALATYVGELYHPNNINLSAYQKGTSLEKLTSCSIPSYPLLKTKPAGWYEANGYGSSVKSENMKLFGGDITISPYLDEKYRYINSFSKAVIIATGDVYIGSQSQWIERFSGVVFAPYGSVTFYGGEFNGSIIAKNGVYLMSGGTTVNYIPISDFFAQEKDFPLE